MDPIRITVDPPLSPEKGPELANFLKTALLADLDREITANPSHNADFLRRRADAGHLRWQVTGPLIGDWQIIAAPEKRLAGAFDQSKELCRIWLMEKVQEYAPDSGIKVQMPENWEVSLSPLVRPRSGNRLLTLLLAAFMVLAAATAGFTLYKIRQLTDQVEQSYTSIRNTVERKTDEILDKVERGISTSDRVVKMMDKVKGLVTPPAPEEE